MAMPEFEPTDQQRESVSCLAAGGHLTVEQIAKTVINPRTGKPVSPRTLTRIFHKELGRHTDLQALVIKCFTEAVDRAEPWAVKLGMEHIVGIKNEETKAADAPAQYKPRPIVFVRSPYRDEPRPGVFDLGHDEYRALPPPIPIEPEPAISQDSPAPAFPPNHIGKYRTEMDDPEIATPWYKKKLTGKLAKGPLTWGRDKPK